MAMVSGYPTPIVVIAEPIFESNRRPTAPDSDSESFSEGEGQDTIVPAPHTHTHKPTSHTPSLDFLSPPLQPQVAPPSFFQAESQSLPGHDVFRHLNTAPTKVRRSNSFSKSLSDVQAPPTPQGGGRAVLSPSNTDTTDLTQTTPLRAKLQGEGAARPASTPMGPSMSSTLSFATPSTPQQQGAAGASRFIQLINHPDAKDIANAIRRFLQKFMQTPPDPRRHAEVVRTFLDITEQQIAIHPLWKNEKEDEEATRDAMEKLLTTKLYKYIFAATEDDQRKDAALKKKLKRLNTFLTPAHLDIRTGLLKDDYITRATTELAKINEFKPPRDKMVCVLNGCRLLYQMLNTAHAAEDREAAGADEFLPVLIYTVARANLPHLHSNVQYIRNYRHPSKLSTEIGYYFTQFESVVLFLSEADHSGFTIAKDLWDRHMGEGAAHENSPSANENGTEERHGRSLNEKLVNCGPMTSSGDVTHSTADGVPFIDLNNDRDLRMSDVSALLTAYKALYLENHELKQIIAKDRPQKFDASATRRVDHNPRVPVEEKKDFNSSSMSLLDDLSESVNRTTNTLPITPIPLSSVAPVSMQSARLQ